MPPIELFPISQSGGLKSISDDDLCGDCRHCIFSPREHPAYSHCCFDWPGLEDANGYVVQCPAYEEVEE